MITHLKLIQKNLTFLVGACFAPDDSGATVISSMGGMGKTSLVFKILKETGGKFLSDDMVIVNEAGQLFAYPKPVRTRHVSIPPLDLETYRQPEILLGSRDKIKETSKIRNVVFLERTSQAGLESISVDEALNKLILINRKLLPYHMERSLITYSYMDSAMSINNFLAREVEILKGFIENANCYIIKSCSGDMTSGLKLLRGIAYGNL
jgi:hypothetical protein